MLAGSSLLANGLSLGDLAVQPVDVADFALVVSSNFGISVSIVVQLHPWLFKAFSGTVSRSDSLRLRKSKVAKTW